MKAEKLTDVQARSARRAPKPYAICDGTGHYLYITPSGSRLWRWSYEYNGKEKPMPFGPYPVISLAVARELHAAAKALLVSSLDPMAVRKQIKTGQDNPDKPKKMTFGDMVILWRPSPAGPCCWPRWAAPSSTQDKPRSI
jgi:hypothetical protein